MHNLIVREDEQVEAEEKADTLQPLPVVVKEEIYLNFKDLLDSRAKR